MTGRESLYGSLLVCILDLSVQYSEVKEWLTAHGNDYYLSLPRGSRLSHSFSLFFTLFLTVRRDPKGRKVVYSWPKVGLFSRSFQGSSFPGFWTVLTMLLAHLSFTILTRLGCILKDLPLLMLSLDWKYDTMPIKDASRRTWVSIISLSNRHGIYHLLILFGTETQSSFNK